MKKNHLIITTLLTGLLISLPWAAQAKKNSFEFGKIVLIEIPDEKEDDDDNEVKANKQTIRKMKKRLRKLERAVRQLQERVFDLEDAQKNKKPEKNYTCYINTPFDGTFIGKGTSQVEARGQAMQKCMGKAGSTFCSERNLKCGE